MFNWFQRVLQKMCVKNKKKKLTRDNDIRVINHLQYQLIFTCDKW